MFKIPENEYRKNLKRFTEILDLEDLIEDIHMKESELEDILKEIYKGAYKNDKNNHSTGKDAI